MILDLWFDHAFQVVVSPPILLELLRVFQYPRIRQRIETDDLLHLMQRVVATVDLNIQAVSTTILNRDPDDNVYLSCAVESRADFLVTGNLKHFDEAGKIYRGVRIVSPRDFLEIITQIAGNS